MKIFLFLVTLLASINGYSQTTIYSEDFEGAGYSFTLNTTDVSSTAAGYNPWVVNNSFMGGSGSLICVGFPFSFSVSNTAAQPAGITNSPNSTYMHISSQEAINNGITCASYQASDGLCYYDENNFSKMSADISTSGLSAIDLNFWWVCGGAVGTTYGEVYYSLDAGATWVLQASNYLNSTTWIQESLTNPLWDNQATLRFGFRFVNLTATVALDPGFAIDDITVIQNCSATNSTINEVVCDSYTSPSGNYTWTSSNTYMDTIPNAANCDSVITINLTILTVDNSVTQTGALLTSNEAGATYQWLDCPGMTPISGETNQSYTATANGAYSVIVTKNGCTDTSACSTVIGLGIIENDFGNELSIYPNPTNGNFSIDLGETYAAVKITTTDLSGKLIQSETYHESQLLNLKLEEPKGVYLLVIESGDKKAVVRLIKE